MAWARLDDGFHDHPKVDGLSLAAVGLYTLCLTWAHRHRRGAAIPGHVTEARVRKLAGKDAHRLATELLTSGLWEPENTVGGFVIHDFEDYLPKQRDVEERREAGRKGAASRWQTDGKPDGNLPSDPMVTGMGNDGSRASAPAFPSRPVPSPDPSNDGSGASTAVVVPRLDVQRLCDHLATRIEGNGARRPTIGKTWLDAARLMLDNDHRTEDAVHRAIDWCQDHEFWRANVLSMPTLRDRYDQLSLQAKRRSAGPQADTDDLFDRAAKRMGVAQ